jgi:hypothetical protein
MAKEEMVGPIPKKSLPIVITVVSVLLVITLIAVAGSNSSSPSGQAIANQQQNQPQQNCKDVQVPYNDIEYYTESEPYTDQECQTKNLVYKVEYKQCSPYLLFVPAKSIITVTNLDNENGGTFTFWVGFKLKDGNQIGKETSQYIYPASSADFSYESNNADIDTCNYNSISIPTKQVCQYVTKFREVQKSRTVVKYKTETQCS